MRIPCFWQHFPRADPRSTKDNAESDGNIHGNAKNKRVEASKAADAKKNESVETPLVHTPPALYHASQSQIKPDDHYKTLKI